MNPITECDSYVLRNDHPFKDDRQFVYIFLRKDLEKINPLYPAIQLGHATYHLGLKTGRKRTWPPLVPDTFCVFEVEDEDGILEAQHDIDYVASSIPSAMFHEPDHGTGWTALAVGPVSPTQRHLFSQYRTYRARKSLWERIKGVFHG